MERERGAGEEEDLEIPARPHIQPPLLMAQGGQDGEAKSTVRVLARLIGRCPAVLEKGGVRAAETAGIKAAAGIEAASQRRLARGAVGIEGGALALHCRSPTEVVSVADAPAAMHRRTRRDWD